MKTGRLRKLHFEEVEEGEGGDTEQPPPAKGNSNNPPNMKCSSHPYSLLDFRKVHASGTNQTLPQSAVLLNKVDFTKGNKEIQRDNNLVKN